MSFFPKILPTTFHVGQTSGLHVGSCSADGQLHFWTCCGIYLISEGSLLRCRGNKLAIRAVFCRQSFGSLHLQLTREITNVFKILFNPWSGVCGREYAVGSMPTANVFLYTIRTHTHTHTQKTRIHVTSFRGIRTCVPRVWTLKAIRGEWERHELKF